VSDDRLTKLTGTLYVHCVADRRARLRYLVRKSGRNQRFGMVRE
jgi:hypothetical protein